LNDFQGNVLRKIRQSKLITNAIGAVMNFLVTEINQAWSPHYFHLMKVDSHPEDKGGLWDYAGPIHLCGRRRSGHPRCTGLCPGLWQSGQSPGVDVSMWR
jgi:hypothetical protein